MITQDNKNKITVKLKEQGIECIIKYPKQSRLKTRLEVLNKLKEELYHN